jgi:hypothetical protein
MHQPRTHLQGASRPVSPRATRRRRSARRARTPKVTVPHALTCRSLHCEAMMPACVLDYKKSPPSPPACRSAIAAAGELTAPLAPVAGQTLLALHYITLELPWPRIELPRPELHRPQWACRRDLAVAACQGHLRPSQHHQSTRGEPNRTPAPHVSLLRPPFATGEPSPATKGTVEMSRGHMCKPRVFL